MITIDILRRAQGEILSLQSYINQLEPRATAFDLLVRTHLGRTGSGGMTRATVDELEEAINGIQDAAIREAAAVAAKAAEKAAKVKKPRKPRTPKQADTQASNDDPAGEGGAVEGSQPTANDPGANAPTPIDSGRRRRGIFGGAPAAAE